MREIACNCAPLSSFMQSHGDQVVFCGSSLRYHGDQCSHRVLFVLSLRCSRFEGAAEEVRAQAHDSSVHLEDSRRKSAPLRDLWRPGAARLLEHPAQAQEVREG